MPEERTASFAFSSGEAIVDATPKGQQQTVASADVTKLRKCALKPESLTGVCVAPLKTH